jgi:hypothetical protein
MVSVGFATLGALENMHEEIIALIPVLLLLSRGLGFGAVTALAMSLGASVIGAAFGPTNPFGAGLALQYAELPALSMVGVRLAMLVGGLGVWIAWTLSQVDRDDMREGVETPQLGKATGRDAVMLGLLLLPFVPYVYGVLKLDWGFNELSALFLVAGYTVGLLAGFGIRQTSERFLEGMASMLAAALFVGVARSISVVMTDGQIMDTILYALAAPLEDVPGFISGGLMVPIHAMIHIAVTSNSGQAVLTMPICIGDGVSDGRGADGRGLTDERRHARHASERQGAVRALAALRRARSSPGLSRGIRRDGGRLLGRLREAGVSRGFLEATESFPTTLEFCCRSPCPPRSRAARRVIWSTQPTRTAATAC